MIAPNGCAECGVERRSHGTSWSDDIGLHMWIEPSDAHRLARMRRNRDLRPSPPRRLPAIGQVLHSKRDGFAVEVMNVDPSGLVWIKYVHLIGGRTWPCRDLWKWYR